jgi:hypothetical protein
MQTKIKHTDYLKSFIMIEFKKAVKPAIGILKSFYLLGVINQNVYDNYPNQERKYNKKLC